MTDRPNPTPPSQTLHSRVMQHIDELRKETLRLAESGDPIAQYHAGNLLSNFGRAAQAALWYHKAAEQGHVGAQFAVATCYSDGTGFGQDDVAAARWYQKAAEQGHAEAQFALGAAYAEGIGIPQSFLLAHMWTNLATFRAAGELQRTYAKARDALARLLTPHHLVEAQRMARLTQYKIDHCQLGSSPTSE